MAYRKLGEIEKKHVKDLQEVLENDKRVLVITSFMYSDIKNYQYDIHIDNIEVNPELRGQGIGTSKMKEIIDFASKINAYVSLIPDPGFGAISLKKLLNFYHSLGFVRKEGLRGLVFLPN